MADGDNPFEFGDTQNALAQVDALANSPSTAGTATAGTAGAMPDEFGPTRQALANINGIDTSGMNGASAIASSSFNTAPAPSSPAVQADAGTSTPTASPTASSTATPAGQTKQQPSTGQGVSKVVQSFTSQMKNGKTPPPSFNTNVGDLTYHALFSTTPQTPKAAPASMPQISQAPVQAAQIATPQMPMNPQMPVQPMQLQMSDIRTKKNIKPLRPDIDRFLGSVYKNVLTKRGQ